MNPHITIWLTAVIFAITYLGLAVGKVPWLRMDRAGIAFVGAAAMLGTGSITFAQATSTESIDYETIFLLLGMMIVVGVLRVSGLFTKVTELLLSRVKSPQALLLVTILLSGILSAFLINDIVCLALTPLVIRVAKKLNFQPLPHLIGLATAANIGSVGTITGNPQNMIIGAQSHISYFRFAAHLFPLAIVGLVVDFAVVAWVFREALSGASRTTFDRRGDRDHALNRPVHRWLRWKSSVVALLAIGFFFAGLPIAVVAMVAAAVLMIGRIKPERIYRQVDWALLLMFVGLFIVVHAFQLNIVSRWSVERWTPVRSHPVDLLSAISAALSNLVSNVPAVMLMEPLIKAVPAAVRENAWLALAMSSTFAGNLTVLGSVANLIVVENAKRDGVPISFWDYSKVGIPVTLLTLALGIIWLRLVRF